jgi:hypothetical protein
MKEYKNLHVIIKNDSINSIKAYDDAKDFYSNSLKYLVLVNMNPIKKLYLSNYDTGYQYKVDVKDNNDQDAIIKYGNFQLCIDCYQENINPRNISCHFFDGFEYEIIDVDGNRLKRSSITIMLKNKSFERDFRGDDWNICKLSSIINLMSFIKSFNDLKEVEETFMSYK